MTTRTCMVTLRNNATNNVYKCEKEIKRSKSCVILLLLLHRFKIMARLGMIALKGIFPLVSRSSICVHVTVGNLLRR